ncbi:hypothetical protein MRB53_041827 [Persea americana]|nr:hypothetical protein MRB53_041827 [Persea americana]
MRSRQRLQQMLAHFKKRFHRQPTQTSAMEKSEYEPSIEVRPPLPARRLTISTTSSAREDAVVKVDESKQTKSPKDINTQPRPKAAIKHTMKPEAVGAANGLEGTSQDPVKPLRPLPQQDRAAARRDSSPLPQKRRGEEQKRKMRTRSSDRVAVDKPWKRWISTWERSGLRSRTRATVDWTDLDRLRPDVFLNDNLIEFGLRLVLSCIAYKICSFEQVYGAQAPAIAGRRLHIQYVLLRFLDTERARQERNQLRARKAMDVQGRSFQIQLRRCPCKREVRQEDHDSSDGERTVQAAGASSPTRDSREVSRPYSGLSDKCARLSLGSPDPIDLVAPQDSTPAATRTNSPRDKNEHVAESKNRKMKNAHRIAADEPTIVVLDSFGEKRSLLIRNLKDYLKEEALAKRNISIVEPKGLNATGLPQQLNFSDCGLYMLGYLLNFFHNPDVFVRKILQRECQPEDLSHIDPLVLRKDLLSTLQNEYARQKEGRPESQMTTKIKATSSPAAAPSKLETGRITKTDVADGPRLSPDDFRQQMSTIERRKGVTAAEMPTTSSSATTPTADGPVSPTSRTSQRDDSLLETPPAARPYTEEVELERPPSPESRQHGSGPEHTSAPNWLEQLRASANGLDLESSTPTHSHRGIPNTVRTSATASTEIPVRSSSTPESEIQEIERPDVAYL